MSSSDSEDDCYGNVAQKLQSLNNHYKEEHIECTNLLNESCELDEIVKNNKIHLKSPRNDAGDTSSTSLGDVSLDLGEISAPGPPKRMTRARARKSGTDTPVVAEAPPTRGRRGRGRAASRPATPRGRGRGRNSNPTDVTTLNATITAPAQPNPLHLAAGPRAAAAGGAKPVTTSTT
ncbi:unnamed protein product [Plutella xylostella]|uniref:(diamondback moth) hypothetical protein n=1 Tax=Plutella xylostella TaxID=51655 RepID=A0A8S4G0R4_PLUXY|nr:unnamed protein product [Plutella xylostella]